MAVINLIAQNKIAEVDSSSSKVFPVEVLTRIELKSLLVSAPIFFDNKIYTTEKSGLVSCFDSTGKIVWKYPISSGIISRAVIVDGTLAVGTCNGDIISIIAFTGEQIQSIGIDDSITTNLAAFEYKGDKELFLPKQSGSKSAIIFGTATGNIYCLDLETLQEYWRNNDSHGSVISQPVVVENKILFSGSDGYLYSIDARNGLLNWRWKETAETDFSNAQIVCDGKKVFVVSKDAQLYCIDLLLGKLIWKADKVKVLPAIGISKNRKDLFAKTFDKRFLIISSDKGTVQKQIKREDEFDSALIPPIDSDGTIYFTNKNSIFALDGNFREEMILEFGESAINTFQLISEHQFLVSTSTGTILIFKPRK
jgi:outer membrane protein assembly factor BamB